MAVSVSVNGQHKYPILVDKKTVVVKENTNNWLLILLVIFVYS